MGFVQKPPSPKSVPRWGERAAVASRRRGSWGLLLRAFVLGFAAVGGAAWGLVRHYTHELPPMRVRAPAPAPTFDADAGEIPVPETDWNGTGDE